MFNFYLSAKGRITRSDYWIKYFLVFVGISIALTILDFATGHYDVETGYGLFSTIFSIIAIWPGFAISFKRLHDRNKSAWWMLLMFIPIIGWIWLLVEIGFLRGTVGPNDFGDDPLGGSVSDETV